MEHPPPRRPRRQLPASVSEFVASSRASPDVWEILRFAGTSSLSKDRIAVRGDSEPLTYATVLARAAALAGWLKGRGVGAGDVVGILASNVIEVMEAHYAIGGSLRAIALNLNWRLAPAEVGAVGGSHAHTHAYWPHTQYSIESISLNTR